MAANGQIFWRVIDNPSLADFTKICEEKNFYLSSIFQQEFLWSKDLFLFVLSVGKFKEKRVFWELVFDLYFNNYFVIFPNIFLCCFHLQTLYFLTLELSIYPIYWDLVLWENWFVVC